MDRRDIVKKTVIHEGKEYKPGEYTVLSALPNCQLHDIEGKETTPARYDARSSGGRWGYFCADHFRVCGQGLGLGKGQILLTEDELNKD